MSAESGSVRRRNRSPDQDYGEARGCLPNERPDLHSLVTDSGVYRDRELIRIVGAPVNLGDAVRHLVEARRAGGGHCDGLLWPGLVVHLSEWLVSGTAVGACPLRAHIDPRLTRFSAGATAGVLAMVLLIVDVARPLGLGLLASQVAVFGFTAFVSFQWSLWAQIYARFIWPRIGAPIEMEDARPPRFAQFLGFVITASALVFFLVGVDAAGYSLTALAFVLAALNASTGLCLGCKAYFLVRREQSARL